MALWDQIKSTFKSNPDVPDDEKLTASMWNQHIEDGHFAADELNFGDDGSGNPVITDPQNSDEIVMRYVRGTGWVPVGGLKLATPLDADNNEIDNASDVDTDSLSGGVSGGTTVSNILGDGLENVSNTLQAALGDGLGFTGGDITASLGDGLDFASGDIQLLDGIWDAGNSELTADVNNTNTTTETLEATNQTYIVGTLSTDQSLTSGDWTVIQFDTANRDNRGEFDQNNSTISVDNDGIRQIQLTTRLFVGASTDLVGAQLLEDGNFKKWFFLTAAGGDSATVKNASIKANLSSTSTYSFRIQNYDSTSTLVSGVGNTFFSIEEDIND